MFKRNLRSIASRFSFNALCSVDDDFTDEERAVFAEQGEPLEPASTQLELPLEAPAVETAAVVAPVVEAEPAAPVTGIPTAPAAVEQAPTMVPHAALHAERLRSAELARTNAQLMARTNAILASRQEVAAPQMPDPSTNPVEYVQALEARVAELDQRSAQEAQTRTIDQALQADERNFEAFTPDYGAASDHYVQSRSRELLSFYTPEQSYQILLNEARQIAQQAWGKGMPAAQAIYQLAQARGYVKDQPSPFRAAVTPAAATTPAVAAPAGGPTPQAVVAAVNNGQSAGRSLSSGAGGSSPNELGADALLAMSDEDFQKYLKLGEKGADSRFSAYAGV